MQCDDYGNCACTEGVEGKRCDRCQENKFNITAGCIGMYLNYPRFTACI